MKTIITKQKIILIVFISVIAITLISLYAYTLSQHVSTDNARVKIANIQVVSEVSGYVTAIHSSINTAVKANDIVLEIDKQRYIFESENAQASFEFLQSEYERKLKLVNNNFISAESFAKAKYDFEIARINLEKANYNLEKTNVTAKSNGILTNFDIQVGDFITQGLPLFNIINKSDMWIEANFKEADIEQIKSGQTAEIKIDTFPSKKWQAKVLSISPASGAEFSLLPAQNFSGNWIKISQRIAVRLEFTPGQDLKNLASGMSAEVKINLH